MNGRFFLSYAVAIPLLCISAALTASGCAKNSSSASSTPTDPFAANAPAQADNSDAPKGPSIEPADSVRAAPPAEQVKVVGSAIKGTLYFPTGDPSTSVLLLEKTMPVEVQANKAFAYDIKVSNVTKIKLEGVEISETVPGTFKIKDVTEGTPDGKSNTVSYLIGALNPGESKIVRLQGTATQSGVLGSCLSAKYNIALCMASNVVAPALKLAAAGPADVSKCEDLPYKFTVTNSGSGQARNVKIEAVLPDGLVTKDGKAAVAFDAGTLDAGQSQDYAFVAKANKTGAFAVKATASADEGLVGESQTVNTTVKAPLLQITKTGPEKSFIGQPIAYEITVTNKGDGVAKNTVVFDSTPKGATVQTVSEGGRADSTGKVRWDVGDLAAGAAKKVVVVITAEQAGDMKTAAVASAECAETQSAIMSTTLSGVPAILVQTSDGPDPVRVGDQTTYTVEITNQGTASGTNIKLVATLEDPMDFISATGTTKETVDGKTVIFAPIGDLKPKTKAVFKITVKANKSGDVRFKATITSDQLTRPVEQTEATNFFGN